MIEDISDVMKVRLDGGRPMPFNFEAQGLGVQYADWFLTCEYDGTAPLGVQMVVECRLAPGVVFYGDGMVTAIDADLGYVPIARVVGVGPLRPAEMAP